MKMWCKVWSNELDVIEIFDEMQEDASGQFIEVHECDFPKEERDKYLKILADYEKALSNLMKKINYAK